MPSRRGLLAAVGAATGTGAVALLGPRRVADRTAEAVASLAGVPATDTRTADIDARGVVTRIELFESGAARIHPAAERGCYDSVALRHSATTLPYGDDGLQVADALEAWGFGDFDEPLTVDLRGAIETKSNYPSRTFALQVFRDDGVCLASGRDAVRFQVPAAWLPG